MTHSDRSSLLRQSLTLIDHDQALINACLQWQSCQVLALDTEFERARTYYPRAGLIQVYDGHRVYLIDPLALSSLAPLFEVLRAPRVLKILHAASQDLEVFYRLGQTLPYPLFDTQIAAAFAGYGYASGYQRLVSRALSVELTKAETRSDWLQRPLTQAQAIYAAQDVLYLLPLYQKLQQRLAERGREHWVSQEMERALDLHRFHTIDDSLYRRIPQAWQLDPRGLEILRILCLWREEQARIRNRPRRFIMPDPVMLEIACRRPITPALLPTIRGISSAEIARSADTLVDLVHHALNLPEAALPNLLPHPGESRANAVLVGKLKAIVAEKAAALGMPPQVLAQNRLLESMVHRAKTTGIDELPLPLKGWREAVIGEALLEALQESAHDCRAASNPAG
ncbi:MAG: ribonuclease D [Gammaproteobacteria bacterium]